MSARGIYLRARGGRLCHISWVNSVVVGRRTRAGDDTWEADTLEWATPSPPPAHNFDRIPVVHSARPLKEDAQPA